MTLPCRKNWFCKKWSGRQFDGGFSYAEVLIATALIAVMLPAILEAIRAGRQSTIYGSEFAELHEARAARMERVKALPYSDLVAAAEIAGNQSTPTSFSDPPGSVGRIVVRIAMFDADNTPFTVSDDNWDGDGNPYTNYQGLLWVDVATEGTPHHLTTLISNRSI